MREWPKIALILVLSLQEALAVRYALSGPTLTVTLKEPLTTEDSSNTESSSASFSLPWLDVHKLSPNVVTGIQSQGPPLPNWFPAFKSLSAGLGYSYADVKNRPSWAEVTGKFALNADSELQLQPSYNYKTKERTLQLQISRGAAYLFARLSSHKSSLVQAVRASALFHLPWASISTVRVTPSFADAQMACTVEAVTGGAGRTKAVLHLERQNPTLGVVYALDDRNVIAPEINLYNARVIYQWNADLGRGSSVRTRVDPSTAIHVTWTDKSVSGGKWVTDVKLPLEGTTMNGMAADVRVRRQFAF